MTEPRRFTGYLTASGVALLVALAGATTIAMVEARVATPAQIEPGPETRWAHGPGFFGLGRLFRELDLTDQQRERARALREQEKEELAPSRESLLEMRKALRDAVTSGLDEDTIRERASAVGVAEGDLAVVEAKYHARFLEILTPEQRQKLQELRAEMETRMQERHQRFREGRKRFRER